MVAVKKLALVATHGLGIILRDVPKPRSCEEDRSDGIGGGGRTVVLTDKLTKGLIASYIQITSVGVWGST